MSVKVIDRGWERIQKELRELDGAYVKVGYPEEKSKSHDGKKPIDMAALAAIHEYGTATIPPRPFLSMTFDSNLKEIQAFIAEEKDGIIQGKRSVSKSLQRLGVFYKGKIQEIFTKGSFQALSPKTIAARLTRFGKASSRPLIATAQLRQSVDFEVVEGKK
jgi:hypothetical protein